jgi:PAS domain S-box-containing protein
MISNIKKVLKYQPLLRFFVTATVFSFVIFLTITGLTVGFSQYKNFNELTKKYEVNQLQALEMSLDQYISNRIKVLEDLSSYPLVIDSVMNMKTEDPMLVGFFSLFKVFGEKGKKALFDIDHNLLFSHVDFALKDFNHEYIEKILLAKKKVFIALENESQLGFYLPVVYNNEIEGVLYYSEKFNLQDLLGDLKDIGISIKTENNIESKYNFDDQLGDFLESDYDRYGIKLKIASNEYLQQEVIFNSLLRLFLSLFVGSLISALFVFVYGKKYLLEPFEKLERAESKLELALDASGIGTWYWDVKAGVVNWDDYIYRVFGASKGDFEHSYESFESFVLPEDREKLKEEVYLAIENNTSLDSEFRIRRIDNNEIRYIGVKAKAVFNEDGELVSMTGINFDITSLKELEQKLKLSQQELSMILDALPAFIFYKDDKNNILRANKYAAESLGLDKVDLINQPTKKYYPDLADKYHRDDLEVINSGKAKLGIEEQYAPIEGEKLWIRTDKVPLVSLNSDKVDSILVMATDITDQKLAKEELKQKTLALEKSNKSFSEFAYFVSHDLQEPIRTVSNYVELLVRQVEKKNLSNDPEIEKYSEYIKSSSLRMRSMIQDILAYSRVGTLDDIKELDLNEIITEIQESLGVIIKERNAKIEFAKLPVVKARRFEMIQLFQNMIVNAINYTPDERTPIVEITYKDLSGLKEFTIKDNGVGIKEENIARIFDLFHRIGDDQNLGTGIGLSICNKVISNYNGEIKVSSIYGQGTEFTFTLEI